MMGSPFKRNKGASVIMAEVFFFRKENHTMETKNSGIVGEVFPLSHLPELSFSLAFSSGVGRISIFETLFSFGG